MDFVDLIGSRSMGVNSSHTININPSRDQFSFVSATALSLHVATHPVPEATDTKGSRHYTHADNI